MNIRRAEPDRDAAAVAAIYQPAIETTIASFEDPAPDASTMAARMRDTLQRFPWLVAVDGDTVVGYAYAAPHAERAGYRWSANISAYVDAAFHGRGIRPAWHFTRALACGASACTSASASSAAGGSTSLGMACA